MRFRSFIWALVLGLVAGVAIGVVRRPWSHNNGSAAPTPYKRFDYTLAKGPNSKAFDIRFKARAKTSGARARLLLNVQDEQNYYYVEFTDRAVQIGRVEAGIEHPLTRPVEPGLSIGRLRDIVVKRGPTTIAVVMDGRYAARAEDDTFSLGKVGFGALASRVGSGKCVELSGTIRRQRIGDVYFADDFMRTHTDESEWEPVAGTWTINTRDNPSLSSNAFSYLGRATSSALSLVGQWFWDDYSFQAACHPKGIGAFGLCFYYRGENDYFLFKWDHAAQPNARAYIIHHSGGQDRILAQVPGGFARGQWYTVRVEVNGDAARAYVDGHLLVRAQSDAMCLGRAGLYTEDPVGTDFDDVLVERTRTFRDDFSEHVPGRWSQRGGKWILLEAPGRSVPDRVFAVRSDDTPRPAKAVAGDVDWRNYTVTAEVTPRERGRVGLCLYYLDDANYYVFDWNVRTGQRRLLRTADGRWTQLDAAPGRPPEQNRPSTITASIDNGHITASINGRRACEAYDASLQSGKVGLWAETCPMATFDDVALTLHPARRPLATIHEVFSHEVSMQVWSGVRSDWALEKELLLGRRREVQWHQADFHGDVGLDIRVERAPKKDAELGLLVGVNPEDKNQGYLLCVENTVARLFCNGRMVGRADLGRIGDLASFRLRKVGDYAVAFKNGKPLFSWRNSNGNTGTKIGFYADGVTVGREDVKVYSNNVLNYTFTKAPADWRVAAGVWEVTNRWQCDPRWSFFSGVSNTIRDPRNLAAIWNKRIFRGDVTVECYVGIKMDRSRGSRYEYAADMNIALCADGRDLTSGYNFIFGGWDNTKTCITKRTGVVAWTNEHLIPRSSSIHRRWFYLRAEKHGNRLRFWVGRDDGGKDLVAEYVDASPLKGNRLALWTWNNGLMVARVRVSFEKGRELELPGSFRQWPCRSLYDALPAARAR